MRNSAFAKLSSSAALLFILVTGCGRDGVKVYKVDSSDSVTASPPVVATAPPSGMPTTMPPGLPAPDNSGLPKLKYALPSGWIEKPLTMMRVGSFDVSEAGKTVDVSVVPLGPSSGGETANVNRWRGQVGLSDVDDAGAAQSAEMAQVGDRPAALYDIAGTDPGNGQAERIIAAILHSDEATWYFKMMGDSALAEKNKAAFIAFLKSVKFQAPAGAVMSSMDMSQLPPSHPAIPGMTGGAAAHTGDLPTWTVPPNWKAGEPGRPWRSRAGRWTVPPNWKAGEPSQFVLTKFVVPGAGDASAAVTVSRLERDGGGLLPNVNRWRVQQLGQPPLTDGETASLPTIDLAGTKATVADFTGTDAQGGGKPIRLIGVVLPLNGQTWFYKFMGDPGVVAGQKDAFMAFVQSAKYP